jgi:hypothetical protein
LFNEAAFCVFGCGEFDGNGDRIGALVKGNQVYRKKVTVFVEFLNLSTFSAAERLIAKSGINSTKKMSVSLVFIFHSVIIIYFFLSIILSDYK